MNIYIYKCNGPCKQNGVIAFYAHNWALKCPGKEESGRGFDFNGWSDLQFYGLYSVGQGMSLAS